MNSTTKLPPSTRSIIRTDTAYNSNDCLRCLCPNFHKCIWRPGNLSNVQTFHLRRRLVGRFHDSDIFFRGVISNDQFGCEFGWRGTLFNLWELTRCRNKLMATHRKMSLMIYAYSELVHCALFQSGWQWVKCKWNERPNAWFKEWVGGREEMNLPKWMKGGW